MWFYELYAIGMPLYMPSRVTLPLYVRQDYIVCQEFAEHWPGHDPSQWHSHRPGDLHSWASAEYWASFTDYLILPHVIHFTSVPDLLRLLSTVDHRTVSQRM